MKPCHRSVATIALVSTLAGCAAPQPEARQASVTRLAQPQDAYSESRTGQAPYEDRARNDASRDRTQASASAAQPQPVRQAPPAREVPVRGDTPAGGRRETPTATSTASRGSPPVSPAWQADAGSDDGVLLHFVDTDIQAVLRSLQKFTGRTFLIDPRVKGTMTLTSEQRLSPQDAYRMLLGALRMQGYAIVDSGSISRVVPEADAKLQGGSVDQTDGTGAGIVTRTFRLSYENAANLVPVLRPLVAPNNTVVAYPGNNTVVVTDYADNLDRIGRIIESIDSPTALDTDVVKMRNGIAVDVAAMAGQLLEAQGNDPTQRIVVVADPRANTVVIRSSSPARTKLARDLIIKLDASQDEAGNLHVVYLRNAQAVQLAGVLRGLLTGETDAAAGMDPVRAALSSSGQANGSSGGGNTGANNGRSNTSSGTSMRAGLNGLAGQNGQTGSAGQGGGSTGAAGSSLDSMQSTAFSAGGATVQADSATNTLLIAAPEPMYRSLRKIIDVLDQRRAQVLVESLIVEVTENNAAELGIQWMAGNVDGVFGGTRFGNAPGLNTSATTTLGMMPGGLNIGVVRGTVNLPGVGEILNLKTLATALQTQGGANILSTPNLLTLDNEPASIMVGQTVPFVSGSYITSGSSDSNPFQTVEREDIGLKLNVRPQISEGGTVKLDIYQEVSSIDDQRSGSAGIVTNKRALDTSVLLDDGQIMVLGGLLEDSVSVGTESVPLLGSIPVLGKLFQYDTRSRVKTNLMVFLRPYVVRNSQDSRGLTQSRYDFMRRAQASVQPGSHWALPDMQAPLLPPAGVPASTGRTYDLREEAVDETVRLAPPETSESTQTRQLPPSRRDAEQRDVVRTNLPHGLQVASDPAAFYDRSSMSVLQFADVQTQEDAQRIAHRARVSGVKAYTLVGPGGMGYVVRADVAREPAAVDTAVQVLRELGYRPEIVAAP